MASIGYWGLFGDEGAYTLTAISLNDAGKQMALCFQVPPSAPTITKVAIRPGALTGSSPTYVVSLQLLDASGNPDGTILGGASPASVEITPAAGAAGVVTEYTLANAYATTRGQKIAVVVAAKSGTTIDGSNFWSFTAYNSRSTASYINAVPFPSYYNGAAWAKYMNTPVGALGDGTTWWGGILQNANDAYNVSITTYIGNKFTIPAGIADTVSCVGFWYAGTMPAARVCTAYLYDASDNLLAQTDVDTDQRSTVGYAFDFWDDAAVALTCGSTYRLVFNTGSGAAIFFRTFSNADHKVVSWHPFADVPIYTSGGTGSWTETAAKYQLSGPIISDITKPTASGGGGPVIGSRIIRGLGAL